MCIEEYVQLVGEEIVDAKYNMAKLVDLAQGREVHLSLDLNEEPMEGNDVDDLPTQELKLPKVHEYAQLLSNFAMKHYLEFLIAVVMNMHSFMDKLNKISNFNINKHHH